MHVVEVDNITGLVCESDCIQKNIGYVSLLEKDTSFPYHFKI